MNRTNLEPNKRKHCWSGRFWCLLVSVSGECKGATIDWYFDIETCQFSIATARSGLRVLTSRDEPSALTTGPLFSSMFCSVLSSTSCKEAFTRFTRFLLLQASFLELPCRFVEYAIPAVSGNGFSSLWFHSLEPYGCFGLWSALQLRIRKRDESRIQFDQ